MQQENNIHDRHGNDTRGVHDTREAGGVDNTAHGDAGSHMNAIVTPVPRRKRIGEILIDRKSITPDQLEEALVRQRSVVPRKLIGEILIDMGVVGTRVLAMALADSVNVPFMDIEPDAIQREAIDCLSPQLMEEYNLLPVAIDDGWLTIAVEKFTDVCLIDDIGRWSGLNVIVVAADAKNISESRRIVLDQPASDSKSHSGASTVELDRVLGQLHVEELNIVDRVHDDNSQILVGDENENSPVVTLVRCVIQDAVTAGASDIHIEPIKNNCRVRYRIDGDLVEKVNFSARLLPPVVSRLKILAGLDISERRLPQDGSITVSLADRPIDLRVSTMTTKFGEKVVMRIVDRDRVAPNLDKLGLDAVALGRFRTLIRETHGIVIVTGPTGSGKTTTLYAALSEILDVKRNVSTIEDPVERQLDGANQFQVNKAANFTFASALRSLLRQDPDTLMVGEIRDTETARLAIEAALTGHLVLTTLHTNDALTSIPRLINMGVEPYLVAASLRGVMAQRLVRRLCQDCKQQVAIPDDLRDVLTQLCRGQCPIDKHYVCAGCSRCGDTGYSGRIGVYEQLILNEKILSAVVREPDGSQLSEHPAIRGQKTLLHDGLAKVEQGVIGIDGLLGIVSRVDDLVSRAGDEHDVNRGQGQGRAA